MMDLLNILKEAASLAKEANRTDLYKAILDYQRQLSDYQRQIDALEDENRGLKTSLRELEQRLKRRDEMVFLHSACWRRTPDGYEGPYCSRCWEGNGKLIHLHSLKEAGPDWYRCPNTQECESFNVQSPHP